MALTVGDKYAAIRTMLTDIFNNNHQRNLILLGSESNLRHRSRYYKTICCCYALMTKFSIISIP
ncbi:UNVERIFIED_CONTAM: hypothetical protein DQE83_25155 [Escherichia coli]